MLLWVDLYALIKLKYVSLFSLDFINQIRNFFLLKSLIFEFKKHLETLMKPILIRGKL